MAEINKIQFKRGSTLSNAGTPAAGEPIYDTSTKKLYIGDGVTAAGGATPSLVAISDDKLPLTGGTLTGTLNVDEYISFRNQTNTNLRFTNGFIRFYTSGTERLSVNDYNVRMPNHSLAIGTSTTTARLNIQGTGYTGTSSPTIKLANTSTNGKTYGINSSDSGTFQIYDDSDDSTKFSLTSAGVGTFAGNVITDGIFKVDSAPDNDVIQFDQSGRKSAIKTYFSSSSTGSKLILKVSDGNTNGGMVDALDIRPAQATFAGNVGINVSPNVPLQFSNDADTRKIVLYEGANNDYQFYGFGIESSTLVYSTYTTSDDHVFFAGTGTSSRNELMRVGGDGAITFNNAFTFPTSIGSAGQVLKVPSSGTTLEWGAAGGGNSISGDLTITDYEPRITLTKTRDTTESFHIAHENGSGVLDFLRGTARTARITNNGRWVIGGYTEVNSSALSVQGNTGLNGDVLITGNRTLRVGGTGSETSSILVLGGSNSAGSRVALQANSDNSYLDSYGGEGSTERYRDFTYAARNHYFKTQGGGALTSAFTIDSSQNTIFHGTAKFSGTFPHITTDGNFGLWLSSNGGDVYLYDGSKAHYLYIYNGGTSKIFLNSNGDSYFKDKVNFHNVLKRNGHSVGFLEGSYTNVGANDTKTNPIYTIGANYNPTDTSLSNMYGIGFSHGNFWGSSNGRPGGWGMYAASGGAITTILDASNGVIWASSSMKVGSNTVWHAGNDGASSGLDADLLDGQQGSYYLATTGDSMSGELNITFNTGVTGSTAPTYTQAHIEVQTGSNHVPAIGFHRGGYSASTLYEYAGELYINAWISKPQDGKIVTSGNLPDYVGNWADSSRNFHLKSPTNTNGQGLLGKRNDGTFQYQIYGDGSAYGFLDGAFAGWDLRKYANGGLVLYGSGDNETQIGSNDEWGRLQFSNHSNGTYVYLNTGSFRVDNGHWATYDDGELDLGGGQTTQRWRNLYLQSQIIGGFGAMTTGGTADWNATSNARSGAGYTLLLGSASNGPSGTGDYFHSHSYEYGSSGGSNNITQFAIPYIVTAGGGMYMRSRYQGSWSGWVQIYDSLNMEGIVKTGNTYGSFNVTNGSNSWAGITYSTHSSKPTIMFKDNHGDGGLYHQGSSSWRWYYAQAHTCMGINGSTTSSSYGCYITGSVYTTGSYSSSDARFKTNIKTIDNSIDKVMNMRGVYYDWNDDHKQEKGEGRQVGVIAQELNEVLPEAVIHTEEDEYSVDYGKITGVLIEAIKDLKNEINELKKGCCNGS